MKGIESNTKVVAGKKCSRSFKLLQKLSSYIYFEQNGTNTESTKKIKKIKIINEIL